MKKLKELIPFDVIILANHFKSKGLDLMVVGGAVRDSLLGITPKDWD